MNQFEKQAELALERQLKSTNDLVEELGMMRAAQILRVSEEKLAEDLANYAKSQKGTKNAKSK